MSSNTDRSNFLYGQWLASAPPGEEVVISGMAGEFPNSHNIYHYLENLETKTDMIDDDDRRWTLNHPEVPVRSGKVYTINRLDSGFFGIHNRLATFMDPAMRVLLEKTVEAVLDAGVNPAELEGSKTAVFSSISWSDAIEDLVVRIVTKSNAMTGILRSFFAQRVSYLLKLKGPAANIDSACSSSSNAIDAAFKAIRRGECENALATTANIVMHPGSTVQFFRLGVLSADGTCKVFDQEANGYVRAEAVTAIFLQKAKNSRRIYAKILNTKVNSDGFKDSGITFPSAKAQQQLMAEIYHESGISPSQISYLEAHGTGTGVGDPEEADAIDLVLAKHRTEPLLVGSVKSSIGHSEPASGICSVVKILLAMETNRISPNIHLKKIREGMKGFEEGRMIPVTELTDLKDDDSVFGLNNFGFGGTNVHIILQRVSKLKKPNMVQNKKIPHLVCVSARTKEGVKVLLNDVYKKNVNEEHISLLFHVFKADVKNHIYRGYAVFNGKKPFNIACQLKSPTPPLYLFFGDFETGAIRLGRELLDVDIFKTTMLRIDETAQLGIIDALTKEHSNMDQLVAFAVQLSVLVLFQELNLKISAVYGDGLGKLVAAFYYELITLQEAVSRALAITEQKMSEKWNGGALDKMTDLQVPLESKFINQVSTIGKIRDDFLTKEELTKTIKKSVAVNVSDVALNVNDLKLSDLDSLLEILGSLYNRGFTVLYDKLYNKFEYPVSRGTPMISPLIKWHHETPWKTFRFQKFSELVLKHRQVNLSYFDDEFKFITGHVIDGRNLIPATQFLYIIWEHFSALYRKQLVASPVVIENCKFIRAAVMLPNAFTRLNLCMQAATGHFEITDKDMLLVSGKIRFLDQHDVKLNAAEEQESPENMLQQDEIYRELYLRGYNYSGLFKGLKHCNVESTYGLVRWEDNWVAFMDKMLQIKILQADTRLLYVPIAIEKIVIDPIKHLEDVEKRKTDENAGQQENKELLMPIYADKETNIIRSGGIVIKGLNVKSIAKKRQPIEPVLEKFEFVPNSGEMALANIIRINTQIIFENSMETNFKAIELLDGDTKPGAELLLPIVNDVLADIPVVNPLLTISTKQTLEEIPGIKIEDTILNADSNLLLIAGTSLLKKLDFPILLNSLSKKGYILTREDLDYEWKNQCPETELFTEYETKTEKILLLKKRQSEFLASDYIEIDDEYQWLPTLQNSLSKSQNGIILYAQNSLPNGLLGLVNCLRREPNGNRIQCFFSFDGNFSFDFKTQNTEMAINVFKDNKRGTYRHLLLEENQEIETKHCFVANSVMGDLSSLKWFEGPLSVQTTIPKNRVLVYTHYASLNFKDVMVATARVGPEVFTTDRLLQESILGIEYSGRDAQGRKVGGMVPCPGISTLILADASCTWYFDDTWSFEEIASVPTVYCTVVYGLLMVAKMKNKASVLIHSAAGGVGLAAINVCRHFNCDIFVTVGTQEKRDYIREHFPDIKESHIGNSRNTSFEEMIKTETNGRGVDIVINSLTDDKLQASVRCLTRGGHFLEIGKYDLANNTSLNLLFVEKEVNYCGVMLDQIHANAKKSTRFEEICRLVQEGVNAGYVKPLPTTRFKFEEIENAFRYMTTGKHIGKVIIEIRDDNGTNTNYQNQTFKATPRFNCDAVKSYVIIGGLGGIGLELADWLVRRGAKKLVLSSRTGVQNAYQIQRIRVWESYGVTVTIVTSDVTSEEGCIELLKKAKSSGSIDAIFNLAAILQDALFENQTKEMFETSLAPKAHTTKYLDQITRESYPELRYFVIFSSVSCGRGNPGQTNYGMANSIMERICERRKADGYPALAIQWGAVGDVGLVAKMQKENKELVIGGTLQQKISSCFEVLDKFLKQKNPVVSSMLVAFKNNRSFGLLSVVDTVAKILGIKDIKTVSPHATLAELGMDSMMGTEMIQVLEKEFDIYITSKEIRSLTFSKLAEIEAAKQAVSGDKIFSKAEQATNFFIQFIPENSEQTEPVVKKMQNGATDEQEEASCLIIFPGIEGVLSLLEEFAKNVNAHVYGVEYAYKSSNVPIEDSASLIFKALQPIIENKRSITVFAHSYGVVIATEVVHLLETNKIKLEFVVVEGSLSYLRMAFESRFPTDGAELQLLLLFFFLRELVPDNVISENKTKLFQCKTFEERMAVATTLVPANLVNKLDTQGFSVVYERLKALNDYKFIHKKLESKVHLVKAKTPMLPFSDDYGLLDVCANLSSITTLDGDHSTVLNQPELPNLVNNIIN